MSHSDSEVNRTKDSSFTLLRTKRLPSHCTKAKNHLKVRGLCTKHYSNILHRTLTDRKLFQAAVYNDTDEVTRQLDLGADPNSADGHGRSPLHVAASKGYTNVVRLLLEKGANPNQSDMLYNTPLHLAACTHNLGIISLLLKAGADPQRLDFYGKNPLQLADSKLQILRKSWREGSIEMMQCRTELQLIVDILISVIQSQKPQANVDELQMMKLSLNSEGDEKTVDDQMSKLMQEMQSVKI